MKENSLTIFSEYLDHIDDTGWVFIKSEKDAEKIIELLSILGYSSKSYITPSHKTYFIEIS